MIELVEEEIRELLTSYKFPGDKTPIAKGSALAAVEGRDDEIGKNSILELMKNVDEFIPQPDRPKDKDFLMPVEDVFSISGRGTVATGRVESGVLKTGDEVEIVGIKETKKSVCTGVEMFRKLLDSGEAGDNVGVLLRGIERTDIEKTSSTGIRKGLSTSLAGCGIKSSTAFINSKIEFFPISSSFFSTAAKADPLMIGVLSPGYL